MSVSLFDIYTEGLLEDLLVAEEATPPAPDRYAHLVRFRDKINAKLPQLSSGDSLKDFYVSPSNIVTVPKTKHKVRGAHPNCGPGDTKLDEQAKVYIGAIATTGLAVSAIPGVGLVAAVIGGIAAALVGFGNTYQTDANCGTAFALVPDCLTLADLHIRAWAGESQNSMSNEERDCKNDHYWGWLHVDPPYLTDEVVRLSTKAGDPLGTEGNHYTCAYKVLVLKVRNWSHSRNIQLYFKAYWDAPVRAGCECLDFSMMSELYRDTFAIGEMDSDLLARYVTRYNG